MPGADQCWSLRKYFYFVIVGSAFTLDEAESSPGLSHVVAAGITIWSAYSMDWKMFQVYLRLISMRATYCRYQRWISAAAFIAFKRMRQRIYTSFSLDPEHLRRDDANPSEDLR